MPIYEKGVTRIHYEEAGSGFPLLIIPGGGLNSTIAGLSGSSSPFNPIGEFKADLAFQRRPNQRLGVVEAFEESASGSGEDLHLFRVPIIFG